jgi:uncharacterized membrane protein
MNFKTSFLSAITAASSLLHAENGHSEFMPEPMEKCYGISAAGKNQCGYVMLSGEKVSCAGSSDQDCEYRAWTLVPKGKCSKLGGFTEEEASQFKEVAPKECKPYKPKS